jgi:tetratricopeptide (TPR) repeat protein
MKDKLKELYDHGMALFEEGKYAEAEPLLLEVAGSNPEFADVQNKLGLIFHDKGEPRKAADYFAAAIRENPRYTEAYLNLIITYNDIGESDRASSVYDRMMQVTRLVSNENVLDPFAAGKLANEHFRLGKIYMDFGCPNDAIDEFRKAVRLRPGLPDIHTRLGMALREKKYYNEAVTEMTIAKNANPHYGLARIELGLTYYMQGLTGQAFEEWEEALEKLPDLKEAKIFLGLFKKGN